MSARENIRDFTAFGFGLGVILTAVNLITKEGDTRECFVIGGGFTIITAAIGVLSSIFDPEHELPQHDEDKIKYIDERTKESN